MTRTPRAAGLPPVFEWVSAHPIPAALAAMAAAVAAGVAISLAIGAIRSGGVAGPPEASTSPLTAASSVASPTATEAPSESPAPSPSAPPLTASPDHSATPALSATPAPSSEPVNGRIAWDGPGPAGGGAGDIASANPDGSDIQILTPGPAEERNAEWSPDGKWLAYNSDAAGGSAEVIGADGPPAVVHTGSVPNGVAWAPDSSRLALGLRGGIAIVDRTGIATAFLSAGEPEHVAWSPMGTKVAFVEGNTLMLGDVDTAHTRIVTRRGTAVRFPMWTPEGRTLLFHGYADNGSTDIFAVDLDGSNLRNVTATAGQFEDVPSLSPDGTHVAMIVFSDATYRIEVMELDGGARRTLLAMSNNGSVTWAPDGTALAVGHGDTITVVPIDGSAAVDIGTGYMPSWGRAP